MRFVFPLIFFCIFGCATSHAEIKDGADLFSEQTKYRAGDLLHSIEHDTSERIIVETLDKAPEGDLAELAKSRIPKAAGMYVIVSKNPKQVAVAMDNSKVYTQKDREKFARLLVDGFIKDDMDEGLMDAVSYVHKEMVDEKPSAYPGGGVVIILLFAAMISWLCTPTNKR